MKTMLLALLLSSVAGCDRGLYINDPPDLGTDAAPNKNPDANTNTGPSTSGLPPTPTSKAACAADVTPTESPTTLDSPGAVTGPDGRIYVFDGTTAISVAYDPSTATWTSLPNMPGTLQGTITAVIIGNTIYVSADQLFAFDVTTRTWRTKTQRSSALLNSAVASDGSKIYVAGGLDEGGGSDQPGVYDPSTDSWSLLPNAPYSDDGQMGAFVGGKFYMIGTGAAAYDVATQKWANIATPEVPRYWASSAVVGGKIIIAGGYIPGSSAGAINSAESYDPSTGVWTLLPTMPTPTDEAAAATSCSGNVFVLGGESLEGSYTIVQSYDPTTNSWKLSP